MDRRIGDKYKMNKKTHVCWRDRRQIKKKSVSDTGFARVYILLKIGKRGRYASYVLTVSYSTLGLGLR